MELTIMVSAVVGLVGLFGISHRGLQTRMDKLEREVLKRITDAGLRTIISDKLQPLSVEFESIFQRIGELRADYKDLDNKLDHLIEMSKYGQEKK